MEKISQIEYNEEQQQIPLSLEEIFKDEEIQISLKTKGPKREKGKQEILQKEDLKKFKDEFEYKFKNKNFNLFNLEEKENFIEFLKTLQDIIESHPDYIQEEEALTITNASEAQNIYSKFPELLLALYFENKTGIDLEKLKSIFIPDPDTEGEEKTEEEKKEKIKELYSIEQIEKFIKVIKKVYEVLKEIKKEREEIKEREEDKKIEIEAAGKKISFLKPDDSERISNILSEGPILFKEELEDMFNKELKELNEQEVKKINEEKDY
ncbi:MAG: hypothetical protein ABH808_02795 [Candidatus Kuenenbacteria bacterium]